MQRTGIFLATLWAGRVAGPLATRSVHLLPALVVSAAGCVGGDREPLGVTAAAGTGQVGGVTAGERRQPISLRALGRLLEEAENTAAQHQVVTPADPRASRLARDVSGRADRSPADRGISGR